MCNVIPKLVKDKYNLISTYWIHIHNKEKIVEHVSSSKQILYIIISITSIGAAAHVLYTHVISNDVINDENPRKHE